ncbi:DEKNAAC105362 [Brettanomyces naardenensis]|uniref:dihydropyrimidinase n=1 Tax=Brettanomyces naardenensis TaxID=13370 RepID=A0A448YTE7_BRENA|nr:DEKNAAC105362 [Brettanomyces naardenensis]
MYDLVIFNGILVNAATISYPPIYIGVKDGKVAAISSLPIEGVKSIDAQGGIITPGGIDSHVHIDQPHSLPADSFETATRSAICGGTTTVCSFANQFKDEESIFPAIKEYQGRAYGTCYCDYGMHLIISNTNPKFLNEEMPIMVREYGITSVKMYMTYKALKLSDSEIIKMLITAKGLGVTTMIHAENSEMIDYIIDHFKEVGKTQPYYHAASRPELAEDEASYRAISLSKLADQSLLIVHMSTKPSLEHVRQAQSMNYPIYSETCPQYLFLTSEYLKSHCCAHHEEQPVIDDGNSITIDQEDPYQGAKYICSPPLRESKKELNEVWRYLENGTVTVYSSDHCPSQYDNSEGKKKGLKEDGSMDFSVVPNGLPGVETRLPLLFCYGVEAGRITAQRFVEVSSTNPAALYGMSKMKGSIDVGLDADIIIWYPKGKMKPFKLKNKMLHHRIDYTPYEGMEFKNWPRYTILRGKVVWDRENGGLQKENGHIGRYLRRGESTMGVH